MGDIPIALEFRHQSWLSDAYRVGTLDFMKQEGWIHTIVDEPQAGDGSIPTVPVATHPEMTLIRMHGRNVHGWVRPKMRIRIGETFDIYINITSKNY